VITGAEAAELASLRRSLGIAPEDAVDVSGELSREAYVAAVRRVVDGGAITPSAKQDLSRLKTALLIRDQAAQDYIGDESAKLYRRLFAFVAQDGEVTAEEEATLDWLQHEARVPDHEVREAKKRIQDIRRFAGYRAGRLPVVQTSLILESGDVCHWHGDCEYHYKTPSQQPKVAPGTLILTGKKIILNSHVKSMTFSPSRVLDIRRHSGGVALDVEGRNGTGLYRLGDPDEFEAVLTGLVRKHKYLAVESSSTAASRHIPRAVKTEVWSRDKGQCVNCGAAEYLEYDHIIPHSKGGASTVDNVQLLCRRCNLEKLDRI
jgi:hypothetical protein